LNTVAEDADLTMNLLEQGFKVVYEDRAGVYRGADQCARADAAAIPLVVWDSAGGVQASRAFLRTPAMGLFALPNIVVFQMLLPLVSPFIDLMFVAGTSELFDRPAFHPEAASAASFDKLLTTSWRF
jgi:hypothetical protein